MVRPKILSLIMAVAFLFMAGSAMAATSVSWLTPPNGSTYDVGTTLGTGWPDGAITGQAAGSGTTGGTGLDLMLVIDTSGSMGSYTDPNSKISQAKNAAVALLNNLPDNTTQVGIITFDDGANTYRVLQDLTSNKTDLINAVNALTAPGPATAIGDGINAATAQLIGPNAIAGHAKMQVVLSDGQNNSGANPVTAASNAAAQGITVHTVGVPGHNTTQMSNIATAGGGVYNFPRLEEARPLNSRARPPAAGVGDPDLVFREEVRSMPKDEKKQAAKKPYGEPVLEKREELVEVTGEVPPPTGTGVPM